MDVEFTPEDLAKAMSSGVARNADGSHYTLRQLLQEAKDPLIVAARLEWCAQHRHPPRWGDLLQAAAHIRRLLPQKRSA